MDLGILSFGMSSIPAKRNEDRTSMYRSHACDGCTYLASFSVFDGHSGDSAANECAQTFSRSVAKRISILKEQLESSRDWIDSFNCSEATQMDAIVCESIRATCEQLNESIQSRLDSGCTLNSLILSHDKLTGDTRVYCANVGDSRCVMYTKGGGNYSRGNGHSMGGSFCSDSDSLDDTGHDSATRMYSSLYFQSTRVCFYALSDDHKCSNERERARLVSKSAYTWHPLPVPITGANEGVGHSAFDGLVSNGEEASLFLQQLLRGLPESKTTLSLQGVPEHSRRDDRSNGDFALLRENSFIGRRQIFAGLDNSGTDDESQPEVLFGRYDFSINMTRSIGDKYGPRSCIATPEVSALTLPRGNFARFVIASDGLWQVLTPTDISRIILQEDSIEELSILANKIANIAVQKRRSAHLRRDDTTVIIIDVNPKFDTQVITPSCHCILA